MNASRKRHPKKRNDSEDHEKCCERKSDQRIHRRKQSTSQMMNPSTNFTHYFENEKIENDQSYGEEECMSGEDNEDLMEHIQILLDSYPKCNFVQQILQRLCNEGTVNEEMIAHLIDRSIRKQTEIQKQIDSLKSNQVKKTVGDEHYQGIIELLHFVN
ncbi:hypothetical protein LOAG_03182 [Loa loa]|uniref:Uncharacterized protein n=1 Tax=Loa loa TaxID=7209 RepID=A0A1S0U582_LOALO|nr:hypothetical protein LOAG_03182 [Loa loa]EFO25301.1 hypothetical protein LOAG_03182 [Loa loa]